MPDRLIPIRQYADTAANLASSNPVLLNRQLAIETDTGKAKLGNGVDNYNDLIYVFVGGLTGSGTTNKIPKFTGSITIGDSQITDNGASGISITNIPAASTDTDKFLVSDAGTIKFRTGSEVLSDIGALSGTGVANRIAFWSDISTLSNDTALVWDNTNKRLLIGKEILGTQVTSAVVASGSDTNIGIALVPKGTGAFTLSVPDNTTSGGNARGQYAVDLQLHRFNNTNVARGDWSTISGGSYNTAGSNYSTVGGGFDNNIEYNSEYTNSSVISGGISNYIQSTSNWATIGGGESNTISLSGHAAISGGFGNNIKSDNSFIGGGNQNIIENASAVIAGGAINKVTGEYGVICGGRENDAIGKYSVVSGGLGSAAHLFGMRTMASSYVLGDSNSLGSAQTSDIRLTRTITGTSKHRLELGQQSFEDKNAVLSLLGSQNGRVWNAKIQFIAVCRTKGNGTLDVGDVFGGNYSCIIKRIGNTTSIVGSDMMSVQEAYDSNMSTSIVDITADNINHALNVEFTPPTTSGSTTVIHATCTVYLTEVSYA